MRQTSIDLRLVLTVFFLSSLDMTSGELLAHSGKLNFLAQLIRSLMGTEHRMLIFCQTRKMLDIIEIVLRDIVSDMLQAGSEI